MDGLLRPFSAGLLTFLQAGPPEPTKKDSRRTHVIASFVSPPEHAHGELEVAVGVGRRRGHGRVGVPSTRKVAESTSKDPRRGTRQAVVGAVGEVAAGEVGAGVVGAGAVGARAEVQKALAKKKRAKRKKQSLRKRLRKTRLGELSEHAEV